MTGIIQAQSDEACPGFTTHWKKVYLCVWISELQAEKKAKKKAEKGRNNTILVIYIKPKNGKIRSKRSHERYTLVENVIDFASPGRKKGRKKLKKGRKSSQKGQNKAMNYLYIVIPTLSLW